MKKITSFLTVLGLIVLACTLTQPSTTPPPAAPTHTATATGPPTPTRASTPTRQTGCTVTAEALHLRTAPGSNASVLQYLHAGDVLKVLPTPAPGAWLAVQTGTGAAGYVNSTFTDCEQRNP